MRLLPLCVTVTKLNQALGGWVGSNVGLILIALPETEKLEELIETVPENALPSLIVTANVHIVVPMGEFCENDGLLGINEILTGTGPGFGPIEGLT